MAKEEEEIVTPIQPLTKKTRITKKSTADDLPATRLKIGNHFPVYNDQRKKCVWCRFKSSNNEEIKSRDAPESLISCKLCNVHLCLNKNRNCFEDFHTLNS